MAQRYLELLRQRFDPKDFTVLIFFPPRSFSHPGDLALNW
jgi:hypothetical protein